jgi:hypothetical protein
VPIADSCAATNDAHGLAHSIFVGAAEQVSGTIEAERMRRGETPGIRDGWRSD